MKIEAIVSGISYVYIKQNRKLQRLYSTLVKALAVFEGNKPLLKMQKKQDREFRAQDEAVLKGDFDLVENATRNIDKI